MEIRKHILRPEDIQKHLCKIRNECKEEDKPLYIASEEHRKYVVVRKNLFDEFATNEELNESAAILKARYAEKVRGEVVSNEMVFKGLHARYEC